MFLKGDILLTLHSLKKLRNLIHQRIYHCYPFKPFTIIVPELVMFLGLIPKPQIHVKHIETAICK